ncbi:MAG: aminotransferase class I/II-fold pyridoxal phosphate-dependent enzyme [Pseudomonadales bacterium]|nr:aminotransferase class I/II-fold pyridoxal phosphate-dependent enzyme [Pseudomonadales bacterium]MDP7360231.1 aminotransferase class I/II-fold pyridoxal phosphate-dependent enzyme [Pseudomonadales bacterium]MDP7596725.1 aminotransferase class I/II-fold pyridoxal phosphate-dependent enzyme [Pseudomonadales bacterium]HJN50277.1 aminotransferase class I/II-fold pyridoxal phosphate-dependent enzyme [Pseudomonadales bacterium]
MSLIAERMQTLGTENAFTLGDNIAECEAMGIKVIRFNLGEPDFDTAEHICACASENLAHGNTHYCPPHGIPALRSAVAKVVSATRGIEIDPELVCVTPGAKPPIGYSVQTYVNPGDEVIYPSPGFPIYESWITYMGGTPVPLHLEESRGFSFTAADLEELITPRTKLIFINSPSNPTGGVLARQDLEEIAAVIREKGRDDIRVYSDEVYEDIIFDGHDHVSIASMPGMAEKTVLVSGHSKSFAMTGWRLGFAILPTRAEHDAFKNLNINAISCTPPFIQDAGREAYENPMTKVIIAEMVSEFQKRRDYAVPALNAIDGITCANPKGAFYVFPNIEGVCRNIGVLDAYDGLAADIRSKSSPSKLFQMFLLYRFGVATMDRKSFGEIDADGKHFLRLSTATDLQSIQDGIGLIARAGADREGFETFISEGQHLS